MMLRLCWFNFVNSFIISFWWCKFSVDVGLFSKSNLLVKLFFSDEGISCSKVLVKYICCCFFFESVWMFWCNRWFKLSVLDIVVIYLWWMWFGFIIVCCVKVKILFIKKLKGEVWCWYIIVFIVVNCWVL